MRQPTIIEIDRQISAINRELVRREPINQMDSGSWTRAWDRHPSLWMARRIWFNCRMVAMDERDRRAAIEARRRKSAEARSYRASTTRCPTCGALSYAAQAAE